jgi:transposase
MWWDEVKRALPDDIKEAIFFVMKKKGLSQEEVGMRLGVTRTTFIGWLKREDFTPACCCDLHRDGREI